MRFYYGEQLLWKWYWKYGEHTYRYRIDPVPHTAKRHYGHSYRRIKTTQERRWCLTEYAKYIRPNRKHLPEEWDEICRSDVKNKKSWKKKKVQKQWMKHL